jgi:hypothetical protein
MDEVELSFCDLSEHENPASNGSTGRNNRQPVNPYQRYAISMGPNAYRKWLSRPEMPGAIKKVIPDRRQTLSERR